MSLVRLIHAQAPEKPQDTATKNAGSGDQKEFVSGKDGTTIPSCYYMPHPPYTKEARDAKFQGTVLVQGIVTFDERLTSLRIVKSPGLGLSESVLTTLKKWKCKPATHDGKPVAALVSIEITFRLK
jgi:periplasmic protein TonB